MPSRKHDDRLAEVTRRRLEALTLPPAPDAAEPELPSAREVPADGSVGTRPGRHALRPVSGWARMLGWCADRMPATLQGRVHVGAAQLGLVALVVAVGLVLTSWWIVRAGGREQAVVPPREVVAATASAGSADATTAGPDAVPEEASVVVDVAGRVRRPGIAVLPAGARVVDALEAAGGVRRGVDLTTLNLARVLVDGEQVLVGAGQPSTQPGAPGPTTGSLVSLNTADQATLETLPGVGPVTAAAIVAWREEHGAFAAVEELLEVSGIGPATLAELMPHVTL